MCSILCNRKTERYHVWNLKFVPTGWKVSAILVNKINTVRTCKILYKAKTSNQMFCIACFTEKKTTKKKTLNAW